MKVYLRKQQPEFEKHLQDLKHAKVMSYSISQLKEKTTEISSVAALPFDSIDFNFLFDYSIFPKNILSHFTQWEAENRKMQIGDTIVQQVYLPPLQSFSVKMIVGVRICKIIDEPQRKGFSYETLEGHVEKGISTFTIESRGRKTWFKIHTFSVPGNWISRLSAPFFSIPYQAFCTRSALENMRIQTEKK